MRWKASTNGSGNSTTRHGNMHVTVFRKIGGYGISTMINDGKPIYHPNLWTTKEEAIAFVERELPKVRMTIGEAIDQLQKWQRRRAVNLERLQNALTEEQEAAFVLAMTVLHEIV